jgi:hypothetical protein
MESKIGNGLAFFVWSVLKIFGYADYYLKLFQLFAHTPQSLKLKAGIRYYLG